MKLAVVDHMGNYGGGSRVVRALLPAMLSVRPELRISYFGTESSIRRERVREEFSPLGIEVISLRSTRLASHDSHFGRLTRAVQSHYRGMLNVAPHWLSGQVHKELEKRLHGFDVAYFPWPYLLTPPMVKAPLVGTFHDFNYRYYFGGTPVFDRIRQMRLDNEMPVWLEKASPVVSSHFMARELAKFYPQAANKTRTIHLAPMSCVTNISTEQAREIVTRLGINEPYLLYPTNLTPHKNIGPLLAATALIRTRGFPITTVLTGPATDRICGKASSIGVEGDSEDPNVVGMGYVSNEQIDALIQCAAVVVSTSLYEAGNGPGIDAWGRGVPVAMSDIPCFTEHLEVLGVKAALFDPRNPSDIAAKICELLAEPERAAADAQASRISIERFTWNDTAREYLEVFDALVSESR